MGHTLHHFSRDFSPNMLLPLEPHGRAFGSTSPLERQAGLPHCNDVQSHLAAFLSFCLDCHITVLNVISVPAYCFPRVYGAPLQAFIHEFERLGNCTPFKFVTSLGGKFLLTSTQDYLGHSWPCMRFMSDAQ